MESLNLSEIGKSLAETIVLTGFAKSKREARQFIKDGAITLNNRKITDPQARLCMYEHEGVKCFACLQIVEGKPDITLLANEDPIS